MKITEKRGTCWVGYQQKGMKKKGDKMVPNCVKEITEIFYDIDKMPMLRPEMRKTIKN